MYEIIDAPCDVIEKLNQEAAAPDTEWSPLIAWISHSTKFIGRLRAWMGSASGHPKTPQLQIAAAPPAASGQAAALLPCPTTTATLRSNHVSWIARFIFSR